MGITLPTMQLARYRVDALFGDWNGPNVWVLFLTSPFPQRRSCRQRASRLAAWRTVLA